MSKNIPKLRSVTVANKPKDISKLNQLYVQAMTEYIKNNSEKQG